jgi:hypothetical protein
MPAGMTAEIPPIAMPDDERQVLDAAESERPPLAD